MTKTFKVIIVVDSSNSQQQIYMNKQLLAIKKELPSVPVEIQNESFSLFQQHAKHHNRVPCYMIFKNDMYKTCKHAKLSNDQAINWVRRMTS